MISLLVAMDRNRVIGLDNDLPWKLPNDLKFFKQLTTGKNVIMGRKTYDSIGRPLPNRTNTIISRSTEHDYPKDIQLIHDIDTIFKWNQEEPNKEFFVIGGGHIFEQVLPYADRMYITWIDEDIAGDTFFPEFNENDWNLTSKTKGERDEQNPHDYYFLQYDRK